VRRRLADLPTLADQQATPRATPKWALETKLDRAIENKAARLDDETKLRAWARAVKDRDHWKDRHTGRRVLKTLALDADRAEAHHIVSKDDWAVRHDLRNGICLSLATHLRVETGKLTIKGTKWFTKNGVRYIDGTAPVRFVRT
jgi:hypothetical protein